MPGIVFKLFGWAALVLIVAYLAASAFRRGRRLDARIRALREEQDELARLGKIQDPYGALADLYAQDAPAKRPNRRGGSRRL